MEDDYSDILGSGVLNVKPQSSLPFGVKAGLWICTFVLLYIIGATAWKNFLRWRELSYRLAMRRRHGIPDDDHRPFNVAYAAVQHAREKREALRRSKSKPMSNTAREQPPSSAQDLRQRTGPTRNVEATWTRDRAESLPKGFRHSTTAGPSRYNPVNNSQQPVLQNEEKVLYPRATELVTSANHPTAASVRISKSGSRRRNYAYMDIDQGPLRSGNGEQLERAAFKRGSKREYGDAEETEDVLESKRAREKRARKISLEKANLDEDMEVDENEFEDENADYGQVSRGKKRDREEAGSTFGGDDEGRSESEEAEDDPTTRRRSRKRRSVAKRKSDLATITRGQKRDRDIDEETSDEGSDRGYIQNSARKRRNKKEGILDEEDVSMEESPTKGKGRKIGEEWTSNGVLCKIGPNGQRLRQTLVKKARQKYHMPQDSQHPDRDANLEVYVETWLTEEEYQDAKAGHLLAWQDTPKASVERDTHEVKVAQPPPSPVGKSLLWKSTATPSATTPDGGSPTSEFSGSVYPTTKGRISYDPRRQSLAVDVVARVNPFHQYPAQASKRIASGNARVSSAGLVDSTNSSPRTGHRMYSKWEKQDLEANAMMKMREAARKKENEEKERQEKERQEKERAEREKAEKDKAAIPSVPIITVTEPAEDRPAGIPTFFAKPAVLPKDAGNSPVAIPSPVSLPGSTKSGEKTPTPTESKGSSFPSATPAPTPFTFGVPGSSPFAPLAKPTVDNTKPGEQPKPPSFAPPQPPSVTSTSTPPTSAPSFFSFTKPSAVPEPKKPEQASGPSLLSRLGPDAAPAAPLQPSTFSFTTPTEAPKSFFSTPASSLAAQPSASTTSNVTAGSSALKFDFKVANKPSTTIAPTPATSHASKPGSGTSTFSFKPTTAPSTESNAGTSGAPQFKFVFGDSNPQTAKDAGGTKEDNSAEGNKQTLTFAGFGAPSVFSNASAGDKTSQPGFGTTGTSSDKSGPSFTPTPKFDTTAPSGSTMGGANKTTGFSAFSNLQNSSSTPDSSSKSPAFGSFAPASGTAAFTSSFNASKPTDGTNQLFNFGKTSTAPTPTPATTTSGSSFALNDTSKAQSSSNPPSAFSFPVNRSPLNKAGASETAATGFSAPPNAFQTVSGSGGSTTNPTTAVFGAGGSGQPASNSTSSSLFGALGSGGQSASNITASSAPSGANVASTFGIPSSQSIFGSTSNSTSTPTAFTVTRGAQPALPTTNSPFGAPSGQPAPSSGPTTTPSAFGGSSIFSNPTTTKPGSFGAFGSAQSTNNSIPQNSASAIQFGQTSMGTPNNTGGQS